MRIKKLFDRVDHFFKDFRLMPRTHVKSSELSCGAMNGGQTINTDSGYPEGTR